MDRMNAALAGLLHDIGKFWQRAEENMRFGPGYEHQFGKIDYGKHGAHATWSAAYIERFIPKLLRGDMSTVLYHHRPQHADAQRLALADHLASGERVDTDEEQPKYLLSIFTQLFTDIDSPSRDAYLPLRPLSLDSLFPLDQTPPLTATKQEYAELWSQFAAEAQGLAHISDPETLVTAVYYLMERYTWSVPAAYYRSVPDISLFDHSRVTAAIATCLTDLDDATVAALLKFTVGGQADNEVPVACLLEGDISGVQDFIYTITARGATPALRGRSFYLQLLTDAVAQFVLRRLELPLTNLIYAGGGHFYMLVPPSADIASIREEVDRILLECHEGDLYLALGMTNLTCADFSQRFAGVWKRVGDEVGAAKRRRFADLSSDLLTDLVFQPRGHGGNEEAECQVCHSEGAQVYTDEDELTPIRKCELCASLEALGRDLRDARQLAVIEIEPDNNGRRDWKSILGRFGIAVAILQGEGEREWKALPRRASRALLFGLLEFPSQTDVDELRSRLHCSVARGLRFAVNVTPYDTEGRHATFEDLQESSQGIKRLGVLRMDVDDLGYIFAHGFQRRKEGNLATLARVAGLSSALSRYFEGWIGRLCWNINDERMRQGEIGAVYSIYSGGDDLFIVGAWHFLPELAVTIATDFQRYVSGNPQLHVSGGMTLHGGKEPLYQAAEAAGQALEAAKRVEGKNTFVLFGKPVKWTDFEQEVNQWRLRLETIVTATGNRSLLQLLLELYEQYEETARRQHESGAFRYTRNGRSQVIWGPYMWRGIYQLKRLADRAGSSQESVQQLINELRKHDFRAIEYVGLAARWTEALTRRRSL